MKKSPQSKPLLWRTGGKSALHQVNLDQGAMLQQSSRGRLNSKENSINHLPRGGRSCSNPCKLIKYPEQWMPVRKKKKKKGNPKQNPTLQSTGQFWLHYSADVSRAEEGEQTVQAESSHAKPSCGYLQSLLEINSAFCTARDCILTAVEGVVIPVGH